MATTPADSASRWATLSSPEPLRRNLASSVVGNVVYTAGQLGLVVILARETSATGLGHYMLALAVTTPVFAFATFKLRQIQATDVAGQFAFGDYAALRLLSAIAAVTGICVVLTALRTSVTAALVLLAVTAIKAFEAIIDLCYGLLQQRELMRLVARSMITRCLAGLLGFSVVLVTTARVELAAGALALLTAGQAGWELRRIRRLGFPVRPRFHSRTLRRLAVLALPLGAAVSIASLVVNVPRFVLGATHGAAEVGTYAAVASLMAAGNTVVTALAASVSPRLASYYQQRRARCFRRLLRRVVGLGAAMGLAGIVATPIVAGPVLRMFYGPEFTGFTHVVLLLMIAAGVSNTAVFIGAALDAIRVFHVQLPTHVVALVAVALTALLAVPAMGLTGAALAVLAGAVVKALQQALLYFRIVSPALRSRTVAGGSAVVGGSSPEVPGAVEPARPETVSGNP